MNNIVAEIVGTRIPKLQDCKFRKEGKLMLILALSDNDRNIISLNETAVRILSLCDGCNDINSIAQIIAEQFNIAFETVREDTIKLICSLEGAKIISTNL